MAPRRRRRWKVAAIQLTSTTEVQRNVDRALDLVARAASRGARLVALPENVAYLRREGAALELRESIDGPLVTRFRESAQHHGVHVLVGSIPERIPRTRRVHNTSILIDPRGAVVATYRKLHLFDIDIPGRAVLRESATVRAGDRITVADTELGRLGLSICYDLRFPELYRRLTLEGAEVIFVPAAFTAFTGPHHWLPLLRARAIENQCWVVAPAQVGRHGPGRRSHGESVVVDPWGAVVARRVAGEGIVEATIDLGRVRRVRRGLPCLRHVRADLLADTGRRVRGRTGF